MAQTVTGLGITKRRERHPKRTKRTKRSKGWWSSNHVRVSAKHERCHIQKLVTAKKQETKAASGTENILSRYRIPYPEILETTESHNQSVGPLLQASDLRPGDSVW